MLNAKPETNARLLAKFVRELLRSEEFDCLADLTDALKFRCARLRIRWTNDDITDAYRLVESNTPLTKPPKQLQRRLVERVPDTEGTNRTDATAILRLVHANAAIKSMPDNRWKRAEHATRVREQAQHIRMALARDEHRQHRRLTSEQVDEIFHSPTAQDADLVDRASELAEIDRYVRWFRGGQ